MATTMNPDINFAKALPFLLVDKGIINDNTPSADVIDLDYLQGRIRQLLDAFPEPFFVHALAVKANPLRGVLEKAKAFGMGGVECASISEAIHGVACGFRPEAVIYDSPCKSRADLKKALEMGIVINLDNEKEIDIVDDLLLQTSSKMGGQIGVRLNPVVGGGEIAMLATASAGSKFGLPLLPQTRNRILQLYRKHAWLTGVHFHVGSQGTYLDLFIAAAKVILDFVVDLEKASGRRLEYIDIGGGLSTSYVHAPEPDEFSFQRYSQELRQAVPLLFSGRYRVITEFGRSLLLKCGKTLARVETVKAWDHHQVVPGVRPILMLHVGSNQFIRNTYAPHMYQNRITAYDPRGEPKVNSSNIKSYDVAGPLCFQGDFIAKGIELPEVREGDLIVIHDTGAYTMAMYSMYNSILPSPVYGYYTASSTSSGHFKLLSIKDRETSEKLLTFWGGQTDHDI